MSAIERGDYLARELRLLGKDESSKPCVVDLVALIERSRNLLAVAAGPTATLTITMEQPVGRVFIDPAQLERALMNLIVNARDASPAGGMIMLGLRELARKDRPAGEATYVVLEVTDTGTGMDAETLKHMFEPLFTTKGEKGTGLGLAIVQRIVTMAGGFVEAESVLGRGTTIRVHLPRIASPDLPRSV
jgi:signal transduction histidine kinase